MGLSRSDALISCYLTAPIFLFCLWFKWPVALLLAGLTALGLWDLFRLSAFSSGASVAWGRWLAVACFAAAWVALAGIGHFVYANFDWLIRDAVLRDLAVTAWPPRYKVEGVFDVILRAPVAYYLPAAMVGSFWGLPAANLALYAWTVLGYALFLHAALSLFDPGGRRWVAAAVLVGFGGLDILGYFHVHHFLPDLGEHIEWWAGFAQYSSNTTQLFWVPNHALPAWLGTVLILRFWKQPALARIVPMLFAVVPLWSPLAALGLVPFGLAGIPWRNGLRSVARSAAVLPWLAVAIVMAAYITMDGQRIPGGWAFLQFEGLGEFFSSYGLFIALEFGLFIPLLIACGRTDTPLIVAVAVLLLLPFYDFGGANDLVMRASIPALLVVALAVARALMVPGKGLLRLALLCLCLLGAVGAAQEPLRAVLLPRWQPEALDLREVSAANRWALPPHYAGRLNHPALVRMMRHPADVPPGHPVDPLPTHGGFLLEPDATPGPGR